MIEKYINERGTVSIPEIQSKFSLTYREVRSYFHELEFQNIIKLDDDMHYRVNLQNKKITAEAKPSISVSSDGNKNDRNSFELEQRKAEIIRCIRATMMRYNENEEIDDNDLDFDGLDLNFLLADGENDIDDDAEEKITSEDNEKAELFDIIQSITYADKFVTNGSKFTCKLGITYPDDTEMQFTLYFEDGYYLSDAGLTIAYISRHFDINDEGVKRLIKRVFDDYSIIKKEDSIVTELCVKILDGKSACVSFLRLFAAIERINNIKV